MYLILTSGTNDTVVITVFEGKNMRESSHDYFTTREAFLFFFHCRECYESIGSNHADALVGFHISTGCGIIRGLLGKSKALWWKPLNCHHKRKYAPLQLWVNMKHYQVPAYLKVISNSLFNISLWFFLLYILAQ